jgi:hypothetical protein
MLPHPDEIDEIRERLCGIRQHRSIDSCRCAWCCKLSSAVSSA